jgi:glucose/arabinose dehydrogenase
MSAGLLRKLVVSALALGASPLTLAAVPANFIDGQVFTIGSPTALAFTPDGRLLVTTQGGTLRVAQGNPLTLVATPALAFPSATTAGAPPPVCTNFERGLLGVAVDPDFATNNYIYLYYTFNKFGVCPTGQPTRADVPVNRVSRFVLPPSNVIAPASETVLVDNILSPNGNHNGGDLGFGKDGLLYISIGDGGADYAGNSGSGGSNDAARDQFILLGKILRITRDGNIPASNPFQGAGTARCNVSGSTTAGNKCQETFAWGLRNPFRMAFDPNAAGTRFFINDVGQNVWEEIDLGQSGVDYGWNCREGAHTNNTGGPCNPTPAGMVDPVFEYRHSLAIPWSSGAGWPGGTPPTNCNSITGGAFVPNGVWPGYDGRYLFSDYVCGGVFSLSAAGPPFTAADFATALGGSSAVALKFGPFGSTQALYYTTFAGGGQVRRIHYAVAGNNPPQASFTALPTSGALPLVVNFDGSASSDPDAGNTLTYFWDFGDGTPEQSTSSATTTHTYTTAGSISARLRVRDNNFAFSAPVAVPIFPGNNAPSPSISSPAPGALFRVGETITLTGAGTDPEEGSLPSSALSWRVLLHHNDHTHPLFGPATGNNLTFTAPPPEDLAATAGSYLEVHLTVTDSGGLSNTLLRNFDPRRVNVTLASSPAGRTLAVNGQAFTAPQTFVSWDNWGLDVQAGDQAAPGQGWAFSSWSDAGAPSHSYPTPASNATLTASFAPRSVISIEDVSVAEGDAGSTPAQVVVRRQGDGGAVTATVSYTTLTGGTATSGSDYQPVTSSIAVPPSATTVTFPVPIVGDTVPEPNETVRVQLTGASGGFVEGADAQIVIRDEQAPDADFNGDALTDIAFRNDTTLALRVWTMSGLARTGVLTTNPTAGASGWNLVGTADFDLNGSSDLVWQNASSRQLVLWRMNGANRISGVFLNPSTAGPDWDVNATGDLDNDGWPDLIFRHATTGDLTVWFMRDAQRLASVVPVPAGLADLNWRLVGTGHFDGDGKADLLWRNVVSGKLVAWLMDGTTRLTGAFLNPPSVGDTNWRAVAVGDFNADGQADVLWRHALSGRMVGWTMNGLNRVAGAFTNPDGEPDLAWQVAGPR